MEFAHTAVLDNVKKLILECYNVTMFSYVHVLYEVCIDNIHVGHLYFHMAPQKIFIAFKLVFVG